MSISKETVRAALTDFTVHGMRPSRIDEKYSLAQGTTHDMVVTMWAWCNDGHKSTGEYILKGVRDL